MGSEPGLQALTYLGRPAPTAFGNPRWDSGAAPSLRWRLGARFTLAAVAVPSLGVLATFGAGLSTQRWVTRPAARPSDRSSFPRDELLFQLVSTDDC